ncbi:MAG TPA: hypothetical protein VEL76_19715 [Gemmataceae bacterium]|nr:hypothetical protein [Gemmataceae bacterium]
MRPAATLSAPPSAPAVCCAVAAQAALCLTADQIAPLRKPIHPVTGEPLAPAFLKNADEQTVAAVAAVFQAIRDYKLERECFTDWGAIAAPRFLGRATMSQVLHRFQQEGAWGISPHHIPHRSLHAVSGTISQALTLHGPNFGVGGGPGADGEAMLIAAGLLAQRAVPGLWVVMSGHTPEMLPADPNTPPTPPPDPAPICSVVALALMPSPLPPSVAGDGWRVAGEEGASLASPATHHPSPATLRGRLQFQVRAGAPSDADSRAPVFSVEALRQVLLGEGRAPLGGWSLSCGGRVELQRATGENCL